MKQILLDKVIMLNAGVFAAISFMEIEAALQLLLLIVSIIYTIIKMVKGVDGNSSINNWITTYFNNFKRKKE